MTDILHWITCGMC